MIDPTNDRKQVLRKRRERLRETAALTVLGCVGVILVLAIIQSKTEVRQAKQQVEVQQARLVKLKAAEAKRKAASEQVENDKRLVFDLLGQCRVASDIPKLAGSQLFSQHRSDTGFVLWVPRGSHRLEFSAEVSFLSTNKGKDESAADEDVDVEVKKYDWTVPLLGATGYMFDLESDRKGGPVTWQLTANRVDFKSRSETIPVDDFRAMGWSYSGSNRALFPNQFQRPYRIPDIQAAAQQPPTVGIYDLTMRGRQQERELTIKVKAELASDAPARVTPTDAASLVLRGHPELLMPYTGGGKFDLQVR